LEAYRIADEPRPSPISHLAVNPFWPLFGLMFAGAWLAFPWFILNARAVGSPTAKREIALSAGALLGAAAIVMAMLFADGQNLLTASTVRYCLLALTVWKLGFAYWIYVTQARTFSIYEYYGGIARNGLFIVLFAAFVGRRTIMQAIKDHTLLALTLQ